MKQIFIYLSFLPLCLYKYISTMIKTDNRQVDLRRLRIFHENFLKIYIFGWQLHNRVVIYKCSITYYLDELIPVHVHEVLVDY